MKDHEPDDPDTSIRWQDMTWRDYVRIALGLVMLILGIAGLVLPILQGILFLLVSAILLAPYSRWVRRQQRRFEQRFPGAVARAHTMAERCRNLFRRNG